MYSRMSAESSCVGASTGNAEFHQESAAKARKTPPVGSAAAGEEVSAGVPAASTSIPDRLESSRTVVTTAAAIPTDQ